MILPSLQVLSILLTGLVAGGLAFMDWVVARAWRTLPARSYVALHQALNRTAEPYMPMLAATSIVGATVLLFSWLASGALLSAALAGVTTLGLIAFVLVTARGNVPINRRVATWSASAPPLYWAVLRDRWIRLHRLRTLAAVTAFLALVASIR
jgi:uncharacterized membrane protein